MSSKNEGSDSSWLPLRDLVVALSLANLCFLRVWAELLSVNAGTTYFVSVYPLDFVVLVVDVVVLGILLALAAGVVRRLDHKHGRLLVNLGFLVLLLLPLNQARAEFTGVAAADVLRFGRSTVGVLLGACVIALGAFVFLRMQHHFARAARTLALILAPSLLFTFGGAAWAIGRTQPHTEWAPPRAMPVQQNAAHKGAVVIVVLDELDRRLVFDERPASVQVPELDRFRAQAIDADSAFSPSLSTATSIPAMLTGLVAEPGVHTEPSNIRSLLFFKDPANWAQHPNLFADVHQLGLRDAVVGWYHPYCPLLRGVVESCAWAPLGFASHGQPLSYFATVRRQLISIWPWGTRQHHHDLYDETFAAAQRAVSDSSYDFVYLHLPVPHRPWIYDRRRGDFTNGNTARDGYFDNVVLADLTLGQLRKTLERHNRWESATVIVTADHPWRTASSWDGKFDARIPFFVKLPGQRSSAHFTSPVRTIHLRDFVHWLLTERVTDPAVVATWFDGKGGF